MFRRPPISGCVLFLALLLCVPFAGGQELAHPGWRGNNITPEIWWKHAAFVRFGADSTFTDISGTLDRMSEVGADSLLLPDLAPAAAAAMPIDARFGTEEELDALLREVSARRMHVLVQVPLQRVSAHPDEVRFWMNRGVAGLDVGTVGSGDMDALRSLRSAMDRFPGQRILMAREPASAQVAMPRGKTSGRDPVTLRIVSVEDAESGVGTSGTPQVVEIVARPDADKPPTTSTSAVLLPESLPALRSLIPLFLASGAPLIDSHMLTTPAQRSALRSVLNLRGAHAALRNSSTVVLHPASPSLRAWLLQGHERGGRSSNLLLVVNESDSPATLGMTDALAHAGARGSYLRPLLRSDGGMGSVNLTTGTLPAGAALLAEIHN